jgi:hypothetical protein
MNLYKDDELTVNLISGNEMWVKVHFKNLYGEDFTRKYMLDEEYNWVTEFDSDLRTMGVSFTSDIILKVDDLFA